MKHSGFMRRRALYNNKNFTNALSLDDDPSDIPVHGDFVWTIINHQCEACGNECTAFDSL